MEQVNLSVVVEIVFYDRTWNCLYFEFTLNIIIGKNNPDTLDFFFAWSALILYFIPETLIFI